MRSLALLFAVVLASCSTTVPVKPKFPEAPKELRERCEQLKKVEATDKVAITEMLKVIVANYGLYYECSTKVDRWNEWYVDQKRIHDSIK